MHRLSRNRVLISHRRLAQSEVHWDLVAEHEKTPKPRRPGGCRLITIGDFLVYHRLRGRISLLVRDLILTVKNQLLAFVNTARFFIERIFHELTN